MKFIIVIFACVAAGTVDNDVQQDMLDLHNVARRIHQALSLVTCSELVEEAQLCANNYTKTGIIGDNNCEDESYGKNFANFFNRDVESSPDLLKSIFRMWYDEQRDYDFDHPGPSEDTSNFTQMIWQGSEELGCATAVDDTSGRISFVCLYSPPGNVKEFKENVFRMKN